MRAVQANVPANIPADAFQKTSQAVRKNTGEFIELANVLINASQHELSGARRYVQSIVTGVKNYQQNSFLTKKEADLLQKFKFTERKLDRLGNLLGKIWELKFICQGYYDNEQLDRLTPQEIEKLGLTIVKEEHRIVFTEVDKKALRNAILQKSREIRPLLEYFKKLLEEYAGILNKNAHFREEFSKRVAGLGFGIQLMEFLEGALIGKFEFKELLSSRTVRVNEKNQFDVHCVVSDINYARSESETIGYKIKSRREDNGVQVLANKLFDLLIATNILANAKRAAEQKGVELNLTIFVHREGDKVLFEFKDNGYGMTPEIMEKLNSGEQVTTKTEEGKHGLGFWYCKELAKRMGGDLYVKESSVGVGTTVIWELKAVEQSPTSL